ncbi:MAG: amidohydrolase family protein [Nitrospiraceae bacterium]|nr:amidohydrolase family protein [Nitrospiraceae bacterium]
MIIDVHVHIVDAHESGLRELLDAADRAGIDRLCISSLGREWREFPTPQDLTDAAEDVCAACEQHPDRFIGAIYASADHAGLSLDLIDRHIGAGPLRFLKLWVSQYVDDPRLNPIVERCIELDVPILAHTWLKATGNMTRESTYHHVAAMARRYPEMKLWMAHAGGRWEEAGRVIREFPNICADLSGGEPEDGIVDCLVDTLGVDRIFWGSDAPGRGFAVQMSKVLAAGIAQTEKDLILGGNIRRWLHV